MEVPNIQENCANTVNETKKRKLCSSVLEIFPDACPEYVHHKMQQLELDQIISEMLEINYPKRKKVAEPEKLSRDAQYQLVLEMLPDADPDYLQMKVDELIDKPEELNFFINEATRTSEYPTRKEYLRKQMLSAQQKQYTIDFNVERFLEVIADPVEYFKKHNRLKLDNVTMHYAICFLRNHYRVTPLTTIRSLMMSTNSIIETCLILNTHPAKIKSKRQLVGLPSTVDSIPLLQQIAYIQHYKEIMEVVKNREESRQKEKEIARNQGILKTCLCCYCDEVMPLEIFSCDNNHEFCKSCIQKSVEISFGEGKLQYPCLYDCNSLFNLFTLQVVLSPTLFSQLSSKLQLKEIAEAGIKNLEHCPYCNFAAIPHEDDKIFKCFNENCMKETCRSCKKPSHLPLKCNEVEEHEIKTRTFIENKLTESLIRNCWNCHKPYLKLDGCNKITCVCGAQNCYVCRQPVRDYNHFNGQGGDKFHLCPLFNDTEKMHFTNVTSSVNEIRRSINPSGSKILNSVIQDFDKYYKKGSKK